jgi:hypothetical protein
MVWRRFRVCAAEVDPGERVAPRAASHDAMRGRGNRIAMGKAMSLAVLCEMFDLQLLGVSWPTSSL